MVEHGTDRIKRGLAEMLKGGVIMDVTSADQARIAEEAGAVAVMALERVPADIRREGGVARMADPTKIVEIVEAVTVPVMAKCRIGHFAEAQVLQALGVDFIDESEVLTPADERYHVDKGAFTVPFVCGATNLGEALRRIGEGAAMIRSKGEAGTGNVVEAVRHLRTIADGIRRLQVAPVEELMTEAKKLGAPYELVREVAAAGKLPVVTFCAGGIATPADASLVMQLGAEGVFVGPGILALQGDFAEQRRALEACGTDAPEVRTAADLEHIDALIIPGGESTTILKLIDRYELREPLVKHIEAGLPVFGTCAGAIVLASRSSDGEPPLGVLDVAVRRNAYGRQRESFEAEVDVAGVGTVPAIFIRAPVFEDPGEGVEVLAT